VILPIPDGRHRGPVGEGLFTGAVIRCIAVEGYRSLRSVYVPLRDLTVVTGGNGSGKSSLYRVLSLLAATARGGVIAALAREGGLESTLWAGPEQISRSMRRGELPVQGTVRRGRVSLRIGFGTDEFSYALDLGLPVPSDSLFRKDPEIKSEVIWSGLRLRPAALLSERRGPSVRCRQPDGSWTVAHTQLSPFESMITEVADPRTAPEVLDVRELLRSWRFYDQIRTDADSPARFRSVGTRTPALAPDGRDLAAALATIEEIGDAERLVLAIDEAFPGTTVSVVDHDGVFDLLLQQPGLLRPLSAAEVSDGTLRYLVWAAALLSPRPPAFLVLNEPENSLHPSLLPALARLVVAAAGRAPVMLVTHSGPLLAALRSAADDAGTDLGVVELVKEMGETRVNGQGRFEASAWAWPKR
jgi:predicted ATPase